MKKYADLCARGEKMLDAQVVADATPRYQMPSEKELWQMFGEDEPKLKCCANCEHSVTVMLGGKLYDLCVSERDNGKRGAVDECDPDFYDCKDWG